MWQRFEVDNAAFIGKGATSTYIYIYIHICVCMCVCVCVRVCVCVMFLLQCKVLKSNMFETMILNDFFSSFLSERATLKIQVSILLTTVPKSYTTLHII